MFVSTPFLGICGLPDLDGWLLLSSRVGEGEFAFPALCQSPEKSKWFFMQFLKFHYTSLGMNDGSAAWLSTFSCSSGFVMWKKTQQMSFYMNLPESRLTFSVLCRFLWVSQTESSRMWTFVWFVDELSFKNKAVSYDLTGKWGQFSECRGFKALGDWARLSGSEFLEEEWGRVGCFHAWKGKQTPHVAWSLENDCSSQVHHWIMFLR